MRQTIRGFILAGAVAGLFMQTAAASGHGSGHSWRGHNLTIGARDDDEGAPLTDCDEINIRFDDDAGVRAEEELPVANVRSLKIRSSTHGSVRVVGWDRPTYAVKACKAAAFAADLAQIRTTLAGNEIITEGSDRGDSWVVVYIIRTPRNATLDLAARNGEISLRDVVGTITARAENGPISLKDSSGTIDAETHNGPIALAGGSGNMRLVAQNGPIDVNLAGSSWEGGKLDVQTENGPLSLVLPRHYRSGVVVESDGHGPVSCRAEGCRDRNRDFRSNDEDDDNDRPRRFELGQGAQTVHLSTNNGPLTVKESR
jgi:hypothetical protein